MRKAGPRRSTKRWRREHVPSRRRRRFTNSLQCGEAGGAKHEGMEITPNQIIHPLLQMLKRTPMKKPAAVILRGGLAAPGLSPFIALLVVFLCLGSAARAELPPDAPMTPDASQAPSPAWNCVPLPWPAVACTPVPSPLPVPPAPPVLAVPPVPLAPAPVAAPPAWLTPPTDDVRLQKAIERRNLGIALLVVGNVLQFAGVSLLVPAVLHGSDRDVFPTVKLGASGGALVGVGNVIEGVGWAFLIRGGRERDRLRREGVQFAPVTPVGRD